MVDNAPCFQHRVRYLEHPRIIQCSPHITQHLRRSAVGPLVARMNSKSMIVHEHNKRAVRACPLKQKKIFSKCVPERIFPML